MIWVDTCPSNVGATCEGPIDGASDDGTNGCPIDDGVAKGVANDWLEDVVAEAIAKLL